LDLTQTSEDRKKLDQQETSAWDPAPVIAEQGNRLDSKKMHEI
jgi:hypothetical protein